MGFKCGIVGLPNVGKSTLFNALTQLKVEAANYPFCTIEPHVGIVPVPDSRLDQVAKLAKSRKVIPATMQFVDIAGLVKGASQGDGLGNQFLAHIRETQAIAHVVRCFDDDDITHVHGKVDPFLDIETIETELFLADLDILERGLNKIMKGPCLGNKVVKQRQALLEQIKATLNAGDLINLSSFSQEKQSFIRSLQLLTLKPVVYIANLDETGFRSKNIDQQLVQYAAKKKAKVIAVCASIEAEIATLDVEDQQEFLESLGLEEPGLNRMVRVGYELLNLHTYFTAGEKEARAWTISQSAKAPEAAGAIHTDFEKGFIRAEVIAFDDYIQCHGEQGAKQAGKWRLEGKDYLVQEGDIMHFRFHV